MLDMKLSLLGARGILLLLPIMAVSSTQAMSRLGMDDGGVALKDGIPCFYAPSGIKNLKIEQLYDSPKLIIWQAANTNREQGDVKMPKLCIVYGQSQDMVSTKQPMPLQYNIPYRAILSDWDVERYNSGGVGRHIVDFCIRQQGGNTILTKTIASKLALKIHECTGKLLK